MPDSFVAPPGWSWDIALYFFFGGMAGGAYFISSLLRLVGDAGDRRLSRIGYYLAFPLLIVSVLLLIKDLGRPGRFWHMVFQSERLPAPMFKWWSPISFGTWILVVFGVLSVVSFVYALVEGGVWRSPAARRVTRPLHAGAGAPGTVFLVLGAAWGLLLAGYTGVLLVTSNAPTWSRNPILPPMFMAAGVAAAGAAMYLVARFAGVGGVDGRHRVLRTSVLALAFETLLLLASIVRGIDGTSPLLVSWWTGLVGVVVLVLGFALPLVLLFMAAYRDRDLVRDAPAVGAALLLVGGILLRVIEVMGGQGYYVPY
ncbi:MAG TPA: NrfD/PsrC family molybdoenzyme membrane anchor subunit [Longimicrobiales bacterium]